MSRWAEKQKAKNLQAQAGNPYLTRPQDHEIEVWARERGERFKPGDLDPDKTTDPRNPKLRIGEDPEADPFETVQDLHERIFGQ